MRISHPAAVFVLAVAVVSLSAQEPQPGFADAVLGRWDLTVEGPDGLYPSWLEITLRKETELMGRFVGRFGSNRHAHVEYRSGDLRVRIPVQYEKNKSDLMFNGRLAGDRLEGTTEDADGRTVKWTAVRAPDLVRPVSGRSRRDKDVRWGTPIRLFSGSDLSGWRLRSETKGSCWSVVTGSLTATPPCVDLVSERTFGDFKLHLDFTIVEKSNSGVYLRGRYEVQIQDDAGKAADSLRMGGVYGFLRPAMNASGQPGEWQRYDITLIGRRVTVVLNGKTVVNDAEIPGLTGGALDSDEAAPGPVMLQGDHGRIAFRNIVITPASDRR